MIHLCLLLLLTFVTFGWSLKPLTIHIIAHTHDDVGWLKTVDEYYYGANETIQHAGVQYILDSVIPALEQNPERKFIYVEIAFFARWWLEQTPAMHARVRRLVANGQLEFINGGWCMNDEAGTHYEATVEQMALGHQFLLETFGVKPTIGWQIDPFGHSATQASLFAQMGFDAVFFARIDYQDYAVRNTTKQLEMVWRPSRSLGGKVDLFTHVLYHTTYCYPDGFAFEDAGNPPIKDDPRLEGVNIGERADEFVKQMREREHNYRTDQLLVTFGCDFAYWNANVNYKNMDKLLAYINARRAHYGLVVKYSTPSEYLRAIHAKNETWSVYEHDFFPYADRPHAYWTGYFTSRPALKGYVRSSNALLRATQRAAALARVPTAGTEQLRAALGTAQHHDAVAGTEKQHVADDYARRLARGSVAARSTLAAALAALVTRNSSVPPPPLHFCPLLNVSRCAPIDDAHGAWLPLTLYNPTAWPRHDFVRLPVSGKAVTVLAPDLSPVAAQLVPNPDTNAYTLVFPVSSEPLGVSTYFIDMRQITAAHNESRTAAVPRHTTLSHSEKRSLVRNNNNDNNNHSNSNNNNNNLVHGGAAAPPDVEIGNARLRLVFDGTSHLLKSFRYDNVSLPLRQNFFWYNESAGNNHLSTQPDGAYIFRPNRSEPFSVCTDASVCHGHSNPVSLSVHRGPWVNEVRQVWGQAGSPHSWVSQTTRVYAGRTDVELVADVGPVPIFGAYRGDGKEVIARFEAGISSGDALYTDAQGHEMQHRRRNLRPSWHLKVNEPVAGNYYPKNSAAYIEDASTRLTIVTDRSSGVASLASGQLEYMLHRRLLHDDHRGVGEPLNETEAIRATSLLLINAPRHSSRDQRIASLLLNHPLVYAFGDKVTHPNQWTQQHLTRVHPMTTALPFNVQLETWVRLDASPSKYLLRLHHLFAVDEDSSLSQQTHVDLKNLFVGLQPTHIEELSLSANQPVENVSKRLRFKTTTPPPGPPAWPPQKPNDFIIQLRAMETRTFYVTMKAV